MTARSCGEAPIKLLVVGPLPPPTHGAAEVTSRVVASLRAAGVGVRVIDTSGSGASSRSGYHLRRVVGHLRALSAVVRTSGPGWVYFGGAGGLGLLYQAVVILACRCRGLRVAYHHHSFAYLTRKSALMWIVCRLADPGIHVSLGAEMTLRLRKLYRVRHVLECSNAAFVEQPRSEDCPASTGPLTVGHLSNLSFDKGVSRAVETFRLLREQAPADFRFLLGGESDDPAVSELVARAQLEFGPSLEYRGRVATTDRSSFYGEVDIFLFPSKYRNEAEPLVVLEAAAHGIVCFAHDVGCLASIIESPGLVVPVNQHFAAAVAPVIRGLVGADASKLREGLCVRFSLRRGAAQAAAAELVRVLTTRSTLPDHGSDRRDH